MNDAVLVVRVTFDGEVEKTWAAPMNAVLMLSDDPDNGVKWAQAWICDVADTTNMGMWDRSA